MNIPDPDQAVPENWLDLVNTRCDLDLAFEVLKEWNHFHTDTIRGRVRSLQLRPQEAWVYFQKARTCAREDSLHNKLRTFYIKVYSFENALIDESASTEEYQCDQVKRYLEELLAETFPSVSKIQYVQMHCKGMYLLHRQDYQLALDIFLQLIEKTGNQITDEMAGLFIATAVAYQGLGMHEESQRQFENACLSIPAQETHFNMGYYACTASALLRLWERNREAKEWDQFLLKMEIPEKTIRIFQERSRRIFERSRALKRVFLF